MIDKFIIRGKKMAKIKSVSELEKLKREAAKIVKEAKEKERAILAKIKEEEKEVLAELGKKTVEFFDGKIDKDALKKVAIEFGFIEDTKENDVVSSEGTFKEETRTSSMFGENGVENV